MLVGHGWSCEKHDTHGVTGIKDYNCKQCHDERLDKEFRDNLPKNLHEHPGIIIYEQKEK